MFSLRSARTGRWCMGLLGWFLATTVFAGGTPSGTRLRMLGNNIAPANGDYINATGGANSFYTFFVEVPPTAADLTVEVFDGDSGGTFDLGTGSTVYRLFDSDGGAVATSTLTTDAAAPCSSSCDNAWFAPFGSLTAVHGHWRIEIETNAGGFLNAFGLRARDAVGGVELNLYGAPYVPVGANSGEGNNEFDLHPYITQGCAVDVNDFDFDDQAFAIPTDISAVLGSRTGLFSQTIDPLSQQGVWLNTTATGWNAASDAVDYGIWSLEVDVDGTSGNNWGVVYAGSEDSGDSTDATFPLYDPEDFRTYFPTSDAVAPVKPFLRHSVRYSAAMGPNPPVVGMTSEFVVTVAVENPTSLPIEFSTTTAGTQRVEATVPADPQISFAGLGAVTVSTGAVSVVGNTVLWAPGIVAANSTEMLSYRLQVKPTGLTDIVVTGSGATGTFGVVIDETCAAQGCVGTRLNNATLTLGDLCPLSVGTAITTHATITEVQGGGSLQPRVAWRTRGELGALAFLAVDDASGDVLGKAEAGAAQGGRYVLDLVAPPASGWLRLVEIQVDGTSRDSGPYRWGALAPAAAGSFEAASPLSRPPRSARAAEGAEESNGGWFGVAARGVYHVPEVALGKEMRLFGEPIPLANDRHSGRLVFAPGTGSVYSAEDVFQYGRGEPLEMALEGRAPAPRGVPTAARRILEFEQDRFAGLAVASDPSRDVWFWKFAGGEAESAPHAIELPGLDGGAVDLEIEVLAFRYLSPAPDTSDFDVEVLINGSVVDRVLGVPLGYSTITFHFDAAALRAGSNDVSLRLAQDSEDSVVGLYTDSLRFDVPWIPVAESGVADLSVDRDQLVEVLGFATADVRVFDVTQPEQPVEWLAATRSLGHGFSAAIQARAGRRYFFFEAGSVRDVAPLAIADESLLDRLSPAEHLIVTTRELVAVAERLRDQRRAQGLISEIVAIEDLYDLFAASETTPEALRAFLLWTRDRWGEEPDYLLLLGVGSVDYRGHQQLGGRLLPPMLAPTPGGLAASDGLFVAGLETVVGRIPVVDADELQAVVDKLILHDVRLQGHADQLVLASDDTQEASFAADGLAATGWIGSATVALDELAVDLARSQLVELVEAGADRLHYFGHGGQEQLADEGLLRLEDVSALAPSSRQPFVTALTCGAARFELPGFRSLAGELVLHPSGGAIATWSTTGVSDHRQAMRLAEALHRADRSAVSLPPRAGDLVRQALVRAEALGIHDAQLAVLALFGDPATPLRPLGVAEEGPGCGSCGDEWALTTLFADDFESAGTGSWSAASP